MIAPYIGLPIVLLCAVLVVAVLRLGAQVAHARSLALLLGIEALVLATSAAGLGFLSQDEAVREVFARIHTGLDGILIPAYFTVLSRLLPSRLLAPFRSGWPLVLLWLVGLGLTFVVLIDERWWFGTVIFILTGFTYALVASVLAARRSVTALGIRRARLLWMAFGLRDIGWGVVYGVFIFAPGVVEVVGWDAVSIVYALVLGLYVMLLTYGILTAHLFDIDVRVKWTVSRGTIAAAAGAVFFILTEVLGQYFSQHLGVMLGVVTTGLVVFFLPKLQSIVDRLADRVAPGHQPTPEYYAYRKMQVYQAALEEAMTDGQISDKERRMLEGMRKSLGVNAADAEAMEREMAEGKSIAVRAENQKQE
jgi:hypothetical protein